MSCELCDLRPHRASELVGLAGWPAAQRARGSMRDSRVQRSEVVFLHMLWEEGDNGDLSSGIV